LVEKIHKSFVGIAKASGALKAYDDGNQVALKALSILNLVDIDEDVAQEISKSL
jgi:hypothetical protein